METNANTELQSKMEAERLRRLGLSGGAFAGEEEVSSGRKKTQATTTSDFTGVLVPAQFKLPQDLCASLKLHAISNDESMSDIVLRCLTTSEIVSKAWVSTRKAS